MNVAAGPRLAAAVTNAGVLILHGFAAHVFYVTPYPRTGGIGVIGGITFSPKLLRQAIDDLRSQLEDKDAPFGVDLALPQVGGGARKTNVGPICLPAGCTTYSWSISTTIPMDSCPSSRMLSSKRGPLFLSVQLESLQKRWLTGFTLLGFL